MVLTDCNFLTNYAEKIRCLGETAIELIAEGHPDSDQNDIRQAKLKNYMLVFAIWHQSAVQSWKKPCSSLRLDNKLKISHFDHIWIVDWVGVANCHKSVQDSNHVMLLLKRFKVIYLLSLSFSIRQVFAQDNTTIGTKQVADVNEIADQLIGNRHSEAVTIAEQKVDLNKAWGDLLEFIDTRSQMLAASVSALELKHQSSIQVNGFCFLSFFSSSVKSID